MKCTARDSVPCCYDAGIAADKCFLVWFRTAPPALSPNRQRQQGAETDPGWPSSKFYRDSFCSCPLPPSSAKISYAPSRAMVAAPEGSALSCVVSLSTCLAIFQVLLVIHPFLVNDREASQRCNQHHCETYHLYPNGHQIWCPKIHYYLQRQNLKFVGGRDIII